MENNITVSNEIINDCDMMTTFTIKRDDFDCQITLNPYPYVIYTPLVELRDAIMENKKCKVNYGKGHFISTKEGRTTIGTNKCELTVDNKIHHQLY